MSAPKMPGRRMRLREVPDHVEARTGNKPTLATVYNWINKGFRGVRLKFIMARQRPADVFPNLRLTTAAWVDEFLEAVEAAGPK